MAQGRLASISFEIRSKFSFPVGVGIEKIALWRGN
jgi:hypothetical protein